MTKEQRAFCGAVARKYKIDIYKLSCTNPFELDTPTAQNFQTALLTEDRVKALELKQAAGYEKSLGAQLVEDGEIELTKEAHEELMNVDPLYAAQYADRQEQREKEIIESMWKGAQEKAAQNGNPDPRESYEKEKAGQAMPFFGAGPMADARRRQWEYQQSMR